MTPHKLVYGVKPYALSWFPIFSVGYFHHKKDGAVTSFATQSPTLVVISIGQATKSNTMQLYKPSTRSIYTTGE